MTMTEARTRYPNGTRIQIIHKEGAPFLKGRIGEVRGFFWDGIHGTWDLRCPLDPETDIFVPVRSDRDKFYRKEVNRKF